MATSKLPMFLYWVTTPDSNEDWFIIAPSPEKAEKFHENYEGYEHGYAEAEEIMPVEKKFEKTRAYHAQPRYLRELGFKIISEDQPRKVALIIDGSERVFTEGLMQAQIDAGINALNKHINGGGKMEDFWTPKICLPFEKIKSFLKNETYKENLVEVMATDKEILKLYFAILYCSFTYGDEDASPFMDVTIEDVKKGLKEELADDDFLEIFDDEEFISNFQISNEGEAALFFRFVMIQSNKSLLTMYCDERSIINSGFDINKDYPKFLKLKKDNTKNLLEKIHLHFLSNNYLCKDVITAMLLQGFILKGDKIEFDTIHEIMKNFIETFLIKLSINPNDLLDAKQSQEIIKKVFDSILEANDYVLSKIDDDFPRFIINPSMHHG